VPRAWYGLFLVRGNAAVNSNAWAKRDLKKVGFAIQSILAGESGAFKEDLGDLERPFRKKGFEWLPPSARAMPR